VDRRYVVLTSTKTAQLPYADAFVPYVKYCITWVDPHHSKLSCYTGVKFLKNILVKGIVTKAAMKGMQENLAVFMPIIKNEVNKIVRKKSGGADSDKSDSVSLKRMGTVKRPSAKTEETMETPAWKATLDTAIEFVQDLLEPLPLFAKAGIAALLFIWFTYSWLRAGTRKSSKGVLDNSLRNQQVISRAVYLRDINEGLLNTEIQPIYAQTDR
jgi:hypothetical protein